MEGTESSGNIKGSLKDRLRFLTILMRISRKNKLRLNFYNINAKRLSGISRIFLFFYTPIKVVLDENLKTNNTILYGEAINKTKLEKTGVKSEVDLFVTRKKKSKKGIALETEKDLIEKAKEEISKKYDIPKKDISEQLAQDYLSLESGALFDGYVEEEIKEALIEDRIKAEPGLKKVQEFAEVEKDIILGRDIDYDIKEDRKAAEKLEKALAKQNEEIDRLLYEAEKFTIVDKNKMGVQEYAGVIGGAIGFGIGLLTLPLSLFGSFGLGASLMHKSLNLMAKSIDLKAENQVEYTVSLEDIRTAAKSLKSSEFLLDDILDKLDRLKYKLKSNDYLVPEYRKKLKEIEFLERGLTKKRSELGRVIESVERTRSMVIKRSNEKH